MAGNSLMTLKVLLPFGVFATEKGVTRIIADTGAGSLGILPRRLDCVAALTLGILVYGTGGDDEMYIAVDEGILIKTGFYVLVSVRNAVGGSDLNELQETVEREFVVLNEREQDVRSVMSKVELDFIQRIAAFSHG
jgi:F-type H+-transporting ATPase subunit epsilon